MSYELLPGDGPCWDCETGPAALGLPWDRRDARQDGVPARSLGSHHQVPFSSGRPDCY